MKKNKPLNILFIFMLLICLLEPMRGQDYYPFSEEELIEIANHTRELERSDSLKTVIIEGQKQKIFLLEQSAIIDSMMYAMSKEEILWLKENKKAHWYDNKYLWFGYGIGVVLASSWAIGNISK